jgi:hypothetical protein
LDTASSQHKFIVSINGRSSAEIKCRGRAATISRSGFFLVFLDLILLSLRGWEWTLNSATEEIQQVPENHPRRQQWSHLRSDDWRRELPPRVELKRSPEHGLASLPNVSAREVKRRGSGAPDFTVSANSCSPLHPIARLLQFSELPISVKTVLTLPPTVVTAASRPSDEPLIAGTVLPLMAAIPSDKWASRY